MKGYQKAYLPLKRFIAIVGSFTGIIVCFGLFWWWIIPINTIASKGNPFFIHERVGRNGRLFKVIKFRSMKKNVNPYSTAVYANHNDMVTPFGRFLRKTSLDETVQLLNIFIGDMAFIGPRPLIYHHEDKITIDVRKENGSISLRPGLSGYAQVHGRVNVPPEEKGKLDGYYFEHISFWLDIKLFFQSLLHAFKKEEIDKIQ